MANRKKTKKSSKVFKIPKEYQAAIDNLPTVVALQTKRAKARKKLLKEVFSDSAKEME